MPNPSRRRWPLLAAIAVAAVVAGIVVAGAVLRSSAEPSVPSTASPLFAPANSVGADAQFPPPNRPVDGWPAMFGPLGDSISAERNIVAEWPQTGPPELWRMAIGSGYSVPVLQDDALILLHRLENNEIVERLDAETGESRWKFEYPTSYKCRYLYSDGPYGTPLIEGKRVYALGAQGQLHCLALDDGELLWRRDLAGDFDVEEGLFGVGAGLLVDDGRLIINVGGRLPNTGIVALDARTGETLWTATDDGAGYATPRAATIHGRRFVFLFTAEGLVAVDPADGGVCWSIPFKSRAPDSVNACSPLVYRDMVLATIGPGPGSVCVRVLENGGYEELWRDQRALDSTWNNRICIDGFIYGYSSKRVGVSFRCVEMASGKVMWKENTELERGSALAVGGRLILLGEHGHLASLDINPHKPVWRSMTSDPLLSAPCYSAPALHRGLLYLRNEGQLLCLDLRQPAGK